MFQDFFKVVPIDFNVFLYVDRCVTSKDQTERLDYQLQSEPCWDTWRKFNIINRTMKVQPREPTCGKILAYCKRQVVAFQESLGFGICVFKIGVTADPLERFHYYRAEAFTNMWVIHISEEKNLIHMLEAALISEFNTTSGCRNKPETGGEGGLNRKNHRGPPFYAYVVGGRADQPRRVG